MLRQRTVLAGAALAGAGGALPFPRAARAATLGIPAVLGFGAELSVAALAAQSAAPLN